MKKGFRVCAVSFIFVLSIINFVLAGNGIDLDVRGRNFGEGKSLVPLVKNDADELFYEPGKIIVKYKNKEACGRAIKKKSGLSRGKLQVFGLSERPENISAVKFIDKLKHQPKNKILSQKMGIDNIAIYEFPNLKRNLKAMAKGINKKKKIDSVTQALLEEFRKNPDVEYAEPNYLQVLHAIDDTYYPQMWSLNNTGQAYPVPGGTTKEGVIDADIDFPEAVSESSNPGEGIIVAVLDTGIDKNHTDIAGNLWNNEDEVIGDLNGDGYPGIVGVDDDGDGLIDEDSEGRQPGEPGYNNDLKDDDDENGYIDDVIGYDVSDGDSDPSDYFGHGTHCAGTIAAVGENSEGIIGIGYKAKIMTVKIFPNAFDDKILEGFIYAADNGAKVLSNSWGPRSPDNQSYVIDEGVNYAYSNGAVIVFAAGNSNSDANYTATHETDKIINVAATNSSDQKGWFSNYGHRIDISAPGVDILSLRAQGTDMYGDGNHFFPYGDPQAKYFISSGTSMACPHGSGLTAVVRNYYPNDSNLETMLRIKNTADSIDAINPGYEGLLGMGRINAHQAIVTTPHPNIIFGSYTIDDSSGNNNGYLDPGETVDLIVTLKNTWLAVNNVSATLSSDYPYLDILSPQSNFGNIGTAGSADNSSNPFQISLSSDVQYSPDIEFLLNITGNSYQTEIPFVLIGDPATQPNFRILDIQQDDLLGNNNGYFEPGETIRYIITLENRSLYILPNVTAALIGGDDPYLQILNDNAGFGTMGTWYKGINNSNPLTVSISLDAPVGYTTKIDLEIRCDYGILNSAPINLTVQDPSIPAPQSWRIDFPERNWVTSASESIIVDVDQDNKLEIVAAIVTDDGTSIWIWNDDGTVLPGWPREAPDPYYSVIYALCVGDIDNDGRVEIVAEGYETIYIWDVYGKLLQSWGVNEDESDWNNYRDFGNSLLVADIDGDGDLEIIRSGDKNYLEAWHHNGDVVNGWPVQLWDYSTYDLKTELACGDIDGDGIVEIMAVIKECWMWQPDWKFNFKVYALNGDGSVVPGWPFFDSNLLVTSLYNTYPLPLIGDIDNDGEKEVVVVFYNSNYGAGGYALNVYVLESDGTIAPGWPYIDYTRIILEDTFPVIADLDGDGYMEIIVPNGPLATYSETDLLVLNHDGTLRNAWSGEREIKSQPVIANVDEDEEPEIIAACGTYFSPPYNYVEWTGIYAWNSDGSIVPGFPLQADNRDDESLYFRFSPAVGDLDNDGDVEIIAVPFEVKDLPYTTIHRWDLASIHYPSASKWPMFQHDARRTGDYEFQVSQLNRIYVDGISGDDSNDGLTFARAKQTIKAGISEAQAGYVVEVYPAIYNESWINLKGGIILHGFDPSTTIINGTGLGGAVVHIEPGWGEYVFNTGEAVVSGFTIKGSANWYEGIRVSHCNPIIKNCVIKNNYHGIFNYGDASPIIVNNVITENTYAGIRSSTFEGPSSDIIKNNIITDNYIGIWAQGGSSPILSYNDVWNNNYNYWGINSGTGDISADSLFVNVTNNDYHLNLGSPCIDVGNPDPTYNDLDNSRNDMGAYGGSGIRSEIRDIGDLSSPEISLIEPQDNIVIATDSVTLSGIVEGDYATAKARVFDEGGNVVSEVQLKPDKLGGSNFLEDISLSSGKNRILVTASNRMGEVEEERIVKVNRAPIIRNIQGNPQEGVAPLKVIFHSDAYDPDGDEISYLWDFGDGQSSSLPNPIHTYYNEGSYQVRLEVTDSYGASSSAILSYKIVVKDSPPLIKYLRNYRNKWIIWLGWDKEDRYRLTYSYRVDDGKWSNWSRTRWVRVSEISRGLSSGYHTFSVKAKDSKGKESAVKSIRFYIRGNTPPIIRYLRNYGNRWIAWYGWDKEDRWRISYSYRIDNGGWSSWSRTRWLRVSRLHLTPGRHTIYVKARDSQGAESQIKSCRFYVRGKRHYPWWWRYRRR